MSQDKQKLMETAERVLDLGKKKVPGAEMQVHLRHGRSANTRFARNEITSTGDVAETTIGVEVIFGHRHASATTNQTDEDSLVRAIDRAAQMAKLAPEDPEHMPLLGQQTFAPVPRAFDEATARIHADQRAKAVRTVVYEMERTKLVGAGFYAHHAQETALANTAGLRAWHRSSEASLSLTARTPDGTGSGWAGAEATNVAEIDPAKLAEVAAQKASRSANARGFPPGRYTVILEPAAVADLLHFFTDALDARRADEGRSFFAKAGGATKLGEKLFADIVTLESNPMDPLVPSSPFDHEGLALSPVVWVDKGVLSALAYSRYWAQKKGHPPTGGHLSMHLHGGDAEGVDDLVKSTEKGLLITRFWYTRWLDPREMVITGLTRDGVFSIENGQIAGPVRNFRFNESPAAVLKNADKMTKHVARPPVFGAMWRVPALRTHEFNLASTSDAV